MASQDTVYHPKDSVTSAIKAAGITGSAGLFFSAVQNTLTRKNVSAWGVFTRTGSTIVVMTAMGGLYEFARCSSANLREKDSSLNNAIGGLLGGSVLGLQRGTTPAVLGYGAMTAILMGAFDYTGGALTGQRRDPNVDEFDRKEYMRKNRRRPIEETIAEVGEGRGAVYGPGYQERRRERLREKYGIEIPVKNA